MTEMIQPKVCAVCGHVLDRVSETFDEPGGDWIHTEEYVGQGDHVAVPVDYDAIPVTTMCDFCYDPVPTLELLVVPARDFKMPLINSMSLGHWSACPTCGDLVRRRRWPAVLDRAFEKRPQNDMPETRHWVTELHKVLNKNITGPVRPFQPGDERVRA